MEPFALEEHTIGTDDGPSIIITAAVHGDEQTATHAARLLWQMLQSAELTGKVTIMPLCNPAAAKNRTRAAPKDHLDLNRAFPGDAEGSYSYQLAAHIWQQTAGYDYLLDLHCCGVYGSTYTMSWYCRHDYAKALCQSLGFGTVIHTKGTRQQLYIEAAEQRGQKALLVELPGGQPKGVIDEEAARDCAEKMVGYLKAIRIMAGAAPEHPTVRFCGCIDGSPKAEAYGLYRPAIKPGEYVKAGQTIAYLDEQAVAAPFDAVVTAAPPLRYVFPDEPLVSLAIAEEVPAGAVSEEKNESVSADRKGMVDL